MLFPSLASIFFHSLGEIVHDDDPPIAMQANPDRWSHKSRILAVNRKRLTQINKTNSKVAAISKIDSTVARDFRKELKR